MHPFLKEFVMVEERDFQIAFSGLKLGAHEFKFEIKESFFELFDCAEIEKGSIQVAILLEKKSTMLNLEFQISGTVELCCDTCTDPYQQQIAGNFTQIVKFSDVMEIEDTDEIIHLPTNEHSLNVTQQLYEFIHLSIPSKRAHADEVNCNQEMLDKLDELAYQEPEVVDPRWTALQNLKK